MGEFRKQSAFTLIELMIALAIVAILATVATTSYRGSVVKGNRRSAQATMMDISQREQQYLLDARAYTSTLGAGGLGYTVPTDTSKFYTVTVAASAGPPPSFTITATPVAGSMQASDGTLTLDNNNAKSPANKW